MQKTKKKLLLSVIALILCFAMLLGSTFAWFTDSATSADNVITTGNFDIEMYWSETILPADSTAWTKVEGDPIFTHDKWEPGYTDVKYVKISNLGNLALQWRLNIEAQGELTELADVIDVYYVNNVSSTITSLDGLTNNGTLSDVVNHKTNVSGVLLPVGEVDPNYTTGDAILAIALHMQEDAGNKYRNMSAIDGEGFTVSLTAAQFSYETDAFGTPDYDLNAEWPAEKINFAASAAINRSSLVYGALANEVVIGTFDGISATIPANVKVANDATKLALSVKAVETDANITLGEGEDARSMDVHIEGIAADNTVPMIVNLGPVFKKGLADTEVKFYHTENGTPVLMTRVDSVDAFAIHNQFTYNPTTGEVSIYVASFSVFSAKQATVSVWDGGYDYSWYNADAANLTISSANQFAAFRTIVDGGYYNANREWVTVEQDSFAGQTVALAVDIDLNGKNGTLFDPIGFGYTHGKDSNTAFMGTFDGGNHTVYNLKQNGWDLDPHPGTYDVYSYSVAGGGLFASIENAIIKNLVVSGADIVFECIDMGIVVGYAQGNCHFENIVVTDSKIANYNRATGGVVGEVCYGSCGTDVNAGFSHTFKNIVVDSSVTVSSLWGSFDTLCGGVIGGKWGDSTVKMENVVSACTLDVFSDVTAAYQWYAYRRCGMLIGHTEQNSPKKALNAAAGFLVCDNVEVYYGDWVNYTYYEFENQDSGTGQRYPWVRAQAGLNNGAFSNPRYGVPAHGGVKVTEDPNMETLKTDYTPIIFGQLYGGGQGVYGCNEHDGVTIYNNLSNSKTFYVINNKGLANLKLQTWFKKGGDTWTTNIDGIDMSSMLTSVGGSTYMITLPAYADGFKILSNGTEIGTFELANLTEGAQYDIDGTVHDHVYNNGVCPCGYVCTHTGGTATCQTQATCSTCGVKYGSLGGHSLYWASDNESYCYKKCHNCSHSEGTTSHQWTGGSCTQCKRTPNYLGAVSDEDIAYGFDTTISITCNRGSGYTVYVMNSNRSPVASASANGGTVSFNVSALGVGTYSIAVVSDSTGQWLDARQFTVRDTGLQKKWTASDIYNGNNSASSTGTMTMNGSFVKLECGSPNNEGQMRLIVDMNGGTSYNGGYLVIKYKNYTGYNNVEVIPSVNGSWANGSGVKTDKSNGTNMYIGTYTGNNGVVTCWNYQNNNTMDGLILDFFIGGISAGSVIEIEYIAFATNPNYIG